jgi:hypothetical protein
MHKELSPLSMRRRIPLSQEIRKIYRVLIIVVTSLTLVLGMVLLYIGNHQTTLGYTLQKLQFENETLKQKNKSLEQKIIEARTTKSIESNKKLETMESLSEVDQKNDQRVTYIQNGNNIASVQ